MLIFATALVAVGLTVVLAVRGHFPRSLPVVLAVLMLSVGAFAVARPAAATTDCPATTVPTTVSVTVPTTTAVSPSSGVATTTTLAATTSTALTGTTEAPPTTVGVVTFCGSLIPRDGGGGGEAIDVFIVMNGGAGTYTVTAPSTGGCDGEDQQQTGFVADAELINPVAYCAANAPGSTAQPGSGAGVWTPAFPSSWYACIIEGDGSPTTTTSTTVADTTTTSTDVATTTTDSSTTTTSILP